MDPFGFDKVVGLKANTSLEVDAPGFGRENENSDNHNNINNNNETHNNNTKEKQKPAYFPIYEDPEPVSKSPNQNKNNRKRKSLEPLTKRVPLAPLSSDQVKLRSVKLSTVSPPKQSKSPSPRASLSMCASDMNLEDAENSSRPMLMSVSSVSSISKRLKTSVKEISVEDVSQHNSHKHD